MPDINFRSSKAHSFQNIFFKFPSLFSDLDLGIARDIQIEISKDFIEKRSLMLSDHLQKSFSPDRYVDIQVASFLIMTSLSGTSKKINNFCKKPD